MYTIVVSLTLSATRPLQAAQHPDTIHDGFPLPAAKPVLSLEQCRYPVQERLELLPHLGAGPLHFSGIE